MAAPPGETTTDAGQKSLRRFSDPGNDAGDETCLGSDPFEESVDADPFLEGLAAMELEPARQAEAPIFEPPVQAAAESPTRAPRRHLRPAQRRWVSAPKLADVAVPDPQGWLDRILGPDERQRLQALTHLVEGEMGLDAFGFSPETTRRAFPFFYALYRGYFRVQSQGAEHLPVEGPAVLAANHGGLLPFDGAMLIVDILLKTDPPRLARAIVDRWVGRLPWLNVFYARVGQVIGTRENFSDLLANGQLVLVFPEGMEGVLKPIAQRYRLQAFHVGFVEQALKQGAPIVPVAVIGPDDQAPILHDFRPLAKQLGLPTIPITPTFPWLGPLGLLPYPVRYRVVYGEPLCFHERFGPEDADDARLVQYLARQVRSSVQRLVDRHR